MHITSQGVRASRHANNKGAEIFLLVQEYIALAVLGVVYILIIGRRRVGIPIWTAMLIGVALMVGLQVIGVEAVLISINLEVIAFLFGMFSIVSALERAGVLPLIAIKMLVIAKTPGKLLMTFVFGMSLLAAFLVNDMIAVLGIPIVIHVARRAGIGSVVLLLAHSFGVTVGSVMTPLLYVQVSRQNLQNDIKAQIAMGKPQDISI